MLVVNDAIYYLNNWLSDHGLSLSIPKSSVVCFTRSRSIPDIDISCNGQNFPIKDKVKFLGMILDSKMTGVHHINYTIQKCEKNLNILRALSGVWWGAHPVSQRLLYNSLIRSLLDYGSFLLLPCSKIALKSLEKIQSNCLRIILGAMKSSPINAMQVECVEPPLQFRRQYLSDKFLFKIYQRMSHPLIPKLHLLHQLAPTNEYWSHKDLPCLLISYRKLINLPSPVYQCRLNPLFETPYQALIYEPEVILNLGIEKHSLDAQVRLNQIISEKWADWLTIYTDASKLSGESHVGSAVWIPKYNIILNFKCPPVCSIFTGEAIAILEALKFAESHKLNKVVLFSDSKSCLQAIRSNQFKCRFKYQFILKIKTLLLDCHRQGLQFVLVWIPSHTGISGNETHYQSVQHCSRETCGQQTRHHPGTDLRPPGNRAANPAQFFLQFQQLLLGPQCACVVRCQGQCRLTGDFCRPGILRTPGPGSESASVSAATDSSTAGHLGPLIMYHHFRGVLGRLPPRWPSAGCIATRLSGKRSMDNNRKHGPGDFAGYLQSIVQLEALERMTQTLDTELADSQKVMLDIKALFDSIPKENSTNEDSTTGHMKYENLKEFFDADMPKLLLPDMVDNSVNVDLDAIISTMKSYAEDLNKKIGHSEHAPKYSPKQMHTLNLEQYASSLDQLSKRLVDIRLNKKNEFSRNPDLEIKLTQLCQDVNMFTQMVQAKTAVSECNKNWTETQHDNNSLYYDNIINKLLSGIHEVTYLLQNKN
ncbi:hypothetical protein evm_013279 [Chilo suppressalis]|nr:hypothetical protein evm_013279 [Chilo suppressalis]